MAVKWYNDSTARHRDSTLSTDDIEGDDKGKESFTSVWRARRVLNLEGDSFAGLFALYVLQELMRLIGERERRIQPPNETSASSPLYRPYNKSRPQSFQPGSTALLYRPCHYFDFICGTSFGGTCAIMLGVMRFTVSETIERTVAILSQLQPKIPKTPVVFATRARRANSDSLEQQLRLVLEDRSSLSSPLRKMATSSKPSASISQLELAKMKADEAVCQTVVFATQKARKGVRRPFVFRSYQPLGSTVRNGEAAYDTTDVSLVDACRASVSAPRYFDSVKLGNWGSFRNADVAHFNPALEAYVEVRDSGPSEVQCLLCLGSSNPLSPVERQDKPASDERPVDAELKDEARRLQFHFRRFSPPELPRAPVGDTESNIRMAKKMAREYCDAEPVKRHLMSWANRLVKYRRERAETVRWTRFAGLTKIYPTSDDSMDSRISDNEYFSSIDGLADAQTA